MDVYLTVSIKKNHVTLSDGNRRTEKGAGKICSHESKIWKHFPQVNLTILLLLLLKSVLIFEKTQYKN